MWTHHLLITRRAATALALVATLLGPALGPPSPARADLPPEPAARVQIVLKTAHIYDDHDLLGKGGMQFTFDLACFAVPTPCFGLPRAPLDVYKQSFSAATGETVTLDQALPRSAPANPLYDASVNAGYPLYPGQRYTVSFQMYEHDLLGKDADLGVREMVLSQENGWAIGTHRLRSVRGGVWGDYEIEFEVRRVPLPDLRPVNITVDDLPGSARKLVCVAVQNVELADAGPFELALHVDDVVPPGGRITAGHLASGDGGELCLEAELPTSGKYTLAAVVDEPGAVMEFNETNNRYEVPYQAIGSATAPTPTPTPAPSATLPDLTVSAIKVNGQVPDGKDDCKDGKNAVTVVVKNGGERKAGDFVVRLVSDDDQGGALEQTVDAGLEAGKELPVTFGGVRLKKGPRSLTATADATSGTSTGISESDENNNTLKVAVRCKPDD